MKRKYLMAAALAALMVPATAAPHGVKVGQLLCHVEGGWGYVVGSSRAVKCNYHPDHGVDDRYVGTMSKLGLDLGYTSSATLVWDVIAPSSDMREGALAGEYAGATASATLAVGLGAHVLLGGFDKSIALQPVSIETSSGVDIAAGIGQLSLHKAPPPVMSQASPAAVITSDRQYVVTFAFDDTRLSPAAHEVIEEAAGQLRRERPLRITVIGHTDRTGRDDYNAALSLKRAEVVKGELVRQGVQADLIEVGGRSDHDPLVDTDPGVRERDNRRVVIEWDDAVPARQASR